MRTICAWCGELIEDGPSDRPVSHGICPKCAARLRTEGVTKRSCVAAELRGAFGFVSSGMVEAARQEREEAWD